MSQEIANMKNLAPRFAAGFLLAFVLTFAAQAAEPSRKESAHRGPPPQAFVWVGQPQRAFSDDEISYIASHYALVVLNPIHGKRDPAVRHQDARRLKAANPDIKVFPYFSMTQRLVGDKFGTDTFKDEWILRDEKTQEIARRTGTRRRPGEEDRQVLLARFVDLSQEGYRRWALQILSEWLAAAPYDGVAFDSAVPMDRDPALRRMQFRKLDLSQEKISAWNDGMARMLSDTGSLGGRKQLVIYNGIAELRTGPDRNTGLLKHADMALNEEFCIAPRRGEKHQIQSADALTREIALMVAIAAQGKKVLQKTNYRNEAVASHLSIGLEQAARFCYGAFLMGYAPGMHFFKFGMNYNAEQGELTKNSREIALPLGNPTGPYRSADGVWTRRFENGVVYVNPDRQRSRTVQTDRRLVLMNGNEKRGLLERGATMDIPPQDAMFLVENAEISRERVPAIRQPRPAEAVPVN